MALNVNLADTVLHTNYWFAINLYQNKQRHQTGPDPFAVGILYLHLVIAKGLRVSPS